MGPKTVDIDLLRRVREHVQRGTYVLVKHAIHRQEERKIRLPDVLRVLEYGRHEREKDVFDVKRQAWKHAIRGRTVNGIELRIIIAFQEFTARDSKIGSARVGQPPLLSSACIAKLSKFSCFGAGFA